MNTLFEMNSHLSLQGIIDTSAAELIDFLFENIENSPTWNKQLLESKKIYVSFFFKFTYHQLKIRLIKKVYSDLCSGYRYGYRSSLSSNKTTWQRNHRCQRLYYLKTPGSVWIVSLQHRHFSSFQCNPT